MRSVCKKNKVNWRGFAILLFTIQICLSIELLSNSPYSLILQVVSDEGGFLTSVRLVGHGLVDPSPFDWSTISCRCLTSRIDQRLWIFSRTLHSLLLVKVCPDDESPPVFIDFLEGKLVISLCQGQSIPFRSVLWGTDPYSSSSSDFVYFTSI